MKRLIKKSKIYNGFNINNKYYEIFINPSVKEIEEIKKSNIYQSLRGIIEYDKTLYIWNGEIIHDIVQNETNLEMDEFRFAYSPSGWIFDANGLSTLEEEKNLIIKYKSILENIGSLNNNIDIYYTLPEGMSYDITYNDIFN